MTRGKASVGHTRRCTYGSPIPTLRDGHLHGAAAVPYDHGTAAGAYQAAGEDRGECPRATLPLLLPAGRDEAEYRTLLCWSELIPWSVLPLGGPRRCLVLRPSQGTLILDPPTMTRGFRCSGGRSIPTRSAAARGVCLPTSPDKFRFEGRPPRAEPEWE